MSEKKKKLKNIAKGETTSKMRVSAPMSHPKAEYMKYAGYDRNEIFDEKVLRIRSPRGTQLIRQDSPKVNANTWLGLIQESKNLGRHHKGFMFRGKVYPINRTQTKPTADAFKTV